MTETEQTGDASAAEVLRLKLRVRELAAAIRNRQETFDAMLEQLQAREEEAVHLASERAARAAAEEGAERLRFLAEASAVLSASLDFEATLASVAQMVVPALADLSAVDLLDERGTLRRVATHHRNPETMRRVRILEERFPARTDVPAGAPKVVRTRVSDVALEIPEALFAEIAQNDEHLRLLRELGITSYIVVPLIAGEEVLGAMTVAYAESNRRYSNDDVALIEDLGRRAATAIQTARLVHGLEEARRHLQQQTEELEAQTEELQQTGEELELNAEELTNANEALAVETEKAELARASAEAANAAKSQFLATMSHELRTPLNAIGGYAELLTMGVHGPLNEAQLEAIERMRRSQRRLLAMVNDVLNFARLEAGSVEIMVTDVSVVETFSDLEDVVDAQMRLKGLTYRFEPCGDDLRVRADAEKMEQVLLNLLSNAMKFTESGGQVRVYCEADATSVRIHVSDTGIGITRENLEQIFDPFVQVNPRREDNQGVGLGLAISRDLARSMGGELRVASVPAEGTTFTFELARA